MSIIRLRLSTKRSSLLQRFRKKAQIFRDDLKREKIGGGQKKMTADFAALQHF